MVIFSKVLTKTDATRRCTIPMKYFRQESYRKSTGELNGQFEVEDDRGHVWKFCCYTRWKEHPKPVIQEGWMPFVKSKGLKKGDKVTIYKVSGLMHYKIKVEKLNGTCKTSKSHVMNNTNKASSSHSSNNQSTTTFQPSRDLSPHILNYELGRTTTKTSSSIDEEKTTTSRKTSQDIACHNSERPSLRLALELTPKSTMKRGAATATRSSTYKKKQEPNPHTTSQEMAFCKARPSLNLNLELTLKTSLTEGEQHAYTQRTIPKTVDYLARFHRS